MGGREPSLDPGADDCGVRLSGDGRASLWANSSRPLLVIKLSLRSEVNEMDDSGIAGDEDSMFVKKITVPVGSLHQADDDEAPETRGR